MPFSATPTAVQSLLTYLRGLTLPSPLTSANINYGLVDNIQPPYVAITDYKHVLTYDVSGPAQRNSTWKMHVYAASVDQAETLAAELDALINGSLTITPYTIGTFQETWETVIDDAKLYVFHTTVEYSMQESVHQN